MRGKKRPASERMQALSLAVVGGAASASEATGIPERTIRLWMDQPEYADLRSKTREELAEGFKALAHLAMTSLIESVKAGDVEPRDLTILLGVATDKHLLMSGEPTHRTESKDTTHDLDNATRQRLTDWIDSRGLDTDPGATDSVPAGAGAEVREPAAV